MSWKKIKNQFRKCEHCSLYYIKKCPYDGIFNDNWYKSKKCNKLIRKKFSRTQEKVFRGRWQKFCDFVRG